MLARVAHALPRAIDAPGARHSARGRGRAALRAAAGALAPGARPARSRRAARAALGGAADHHRSAPEAASMARASGERAAVAIGDDGDRDRVLDGARPPPIGRALVELAACAAMHRDEP